MMGRYAQIVDCDRCMAARHGTVDRIEHALDADCRVGKVDEEHASAVIGPGHDDADLRALRAGNERLAAVDHPMVAVAVAGGLQHRGVGTGSAIVSGFGHEKGGTRLAMYQWR